MPYEFPYPREEICDLEQAKYLLFSRGPGVVVVHGQIVHCYEELKEIAMEKCKEEKSIDVLLLPIFEGG